MIRKEFRSDIALIESDMISEIVSDLGGVPRHVTGSLNPKDLNDWIVELED